MTGRPPDYCAWWDLMEVMLRHGGEATMADFEREGGYAPGTVERVVKVAVSRGVFVAESVTARHENGGYRLHRFRLSPLATEHIDLLAALSKSLA